MSIVSQSEFLNEFVAALFLPHTNPKVTGIKPKAPSVTICPASGQESEPLSEEEIKTIIASYKLAAQKALEAGVNPKKSIRVSPRQKLSAMPGMSKISSAQCRQAIV